MRALLILICCAVVSAAAAESIRAVDWKNFLYPLPETHGVPGVVRWMTLGTKESASLVNGRYVVPGDCSDDIRFCPLVTFDSVKYGALTGIKSSIAAVVLTYHSGGTAHWQYVYLFAFESSRPRLVAWLRTGSRADQGLRDVAITGGDLVLTVNDPDKRGGDCCSAGSITKRYRWLGSSFSAIGQPIYKTDPPSFDCAKAATPAEQLICRDWRLSDMDNSMAYSYQLALKNASTERKAIIRQQQEEWFAAYSQTCNAPLSETERGECIIQYLNDRLIALMKKN